MGCSYDKMMIVPSITFEALFAGVNGTNIATSYGLEYFLTPHNPYTSNQTAKLELGRPMQLLDPWRWHVDKVKLRKPQGLVEFLG